MSDSMRPASPAIDVPRQIDAIYTRIQTILVEARRNAALTVHSEMVPAYWLIGQEIVEDEQRGEARAGYGEELIARPSERLQREFGRGFAPANPKHMRLFYSMYPRLLEPEIGHAARDQSADPIALAPSGDPLDGAGRLNPSLSWTHYRLLTK